MDIKTRTEVTGVTIDLTLQEVQDLRNCILELDKYRLDESILRYGCGAPYIPREFDLSLLALLEKVTE